MLLTMLMDDHSNADAIHVETIEEVLYAIVNVRRNTATNSQPATLQLFFHFQDTAGHCLHNCGMTISNYI